MKIIGNVKVFLSDEKREVLAGYFPSIHFQYDRIDNKIFPTWKKFYGDSDVQTLISECKIMHSQIKSVKGDVEGFFMVASPDDNIYAIILFEDDGVKVKGWDNGRSLDS